mgnify:CR=1 FL=1
MKIYTSYFGNHRKLEASNIKMICVALGKPKYYNAPQIICWMINGLMKNTRTCI